MQRAARPAKAGLKDPIVGLSSCGASSSDAAAGGPAGKAGSLGIGAAKA